MYVRLKSCILFDADVLSLYLRVWALLTLQINKSFFIEILSVLFETNYCLLLRFLVGLETFSGV